MRNERIKVLVTCPPMIQAKDHFLPIFDKLGWEAIIPRFEQMVPEEQLCEMIKDVDGWIIGDDQATYKVVKSGKEGKLQAAVKWGIGTDNIDFNAFEEFHIPIENTPGMFNDEVADVAIGYLISLARDLTFIDREVRNKNWLKPQGKSLRGMKCAIVGFGNIGQNLYKKLKVFGLDTFAYDPLFSEKEYPSGCKIERWPNRLEEVEVIIFTCSLTKENYQMFNKDILRKLKVGSFVINVGRGGLIEEETILKGLKSGIISKVALDVFAEEPAKNEALIAHPKCIFGSHNSSNTKEAVLKTNKKTIEILKSFLVD